MADNTSNRVHVDNLPCTDSGGLRVELVPMPSSADPWRTHAEYVRDQKRDTARFCLTIGSLLVSIAGVAATAFVAIHEIKQASAEVSPAAGTEEVSEDSESQAENPNARSSGTSLVAVPFLFSEDEATSQSDLSKTIPPSTALASSQFFSVPFTRLEYVLMRLEQRLNEDTELIREQAVRHFDPSPRVLPITLEGFARYSRDLGRVIVGYRIDGLGRPRRSMRETCDALLAYLEVLAPQEMLGALYHNTVLGVLAQRDPAHYTAPLTALAESIVHRVRLQSNTDGKSEGEVLVHYLTCQRAEKDGDLSYSKFSFSLGPNS